jgi:hypothetical protein
MVSYDTEAILINALGDEWGGGELWDLYESIENPKQFFAIFVYIFCGILFTIGVVMLGFYSRNTDKDHLLFGGIGLIVFSLIVLALYHFI